MLSLGATGVSSATDTGGGAGYKLGCGGHAEEAYSRDTGKYVKAAGGGSNGPEYRGKASTRPQPAQARQEARKVVNPAGGYDPQGNPVYTYMQCSGNVYNPEGGLMGTGYSGKGPGLNNPKMEHVPFVGPIPAGFYRVGAAIPSHRRLGAYVLPLIPEGNTVNKLEGLSRGGFYWHGADPQRPLDSSEGCIVSPLALRQKVSTDALVRVLTCEEQ